VKTSKNIPIKFVPTCFLVRIGPVAELIVPIDYNVRSWFPACFFIDYNVRSWFPAWFSKMCPWYIV